MLNSRDLQHFLCGAAVGVVVTALLSPRSGPQYRELVKSKARDAADRVRQAEEALQERTSELKQGVDRKRRQMQDAIEAGRQAYQKAAAASAGNAHAHQV